MSNNEIENEPRRFAQMKEISLSRLEDCTFSSIPYKKEETILFEEEDNDQQKAKQEKQNLHNRKQSKFKDEYLQTMKPKDNSFLPATINVQNINLSFDGSMIFQSRDLTIQKTQYNQLEPCQKQEKVVSKLTIENIDQKNQDSSSRIEENVINRIGQQLAQQKQPNNFKVSMFLKIWKFYANISANSRIFSKLTKNQHDIINDKSSFFDSMVTLYQIKFYNGYLMNYLQYSFKQLIKKIPFFPVFMRSSLIVRILEIIQALSIISTQFIFSLVIFFEEDSKGYLKLFSFSLLIQLIGMILQFNTAAIKQGNIITSRKKIAKKYLRMNFFIDILGQSPLLIEIFKVQISNIYIKYAFYFLILLLNIKLKTILDNLTFYLSFEKNLKNTIDFIKLILIIGLICHIFCLFWHVIAVIEIKNGQQKTWLHLVNLQEETSVLIRYIYSFYYLAVTMITVGYGDITPQNQYEISFTILTMFVTGFYYAFSLNKIGSILDNINRKDKLYNQQMQIIHGYMRNENVTSNLRGKISSYLKYLYKKSNEVQRNNEKLIVDQLSKQLKIDLTQEVSGKYLQNIPFLNELKSKNKIIELMEECLFSPGETIFSQGELDDCSLYFIVKGDVQILFKQKTEQSSSVIKQLQKGQFFGEYSFLTNQMRLSTAVAQDFCRLYRIQKEKYMNVIRENEYDFENFCMIRDLALLSQNYSSTSVRCYSCDKNSHHFMQCPKTHYIRSKKAIILQQNRPFTQVNRQYSHRRGKKINSLIDQQLIIQAAYLINKECGLSGLINEIPSMISDLNLYSIEFDQNRIIQELQETYEQEAQKISSKGSSSNLNAYYSQFSKNLFQSQKQTTNVLNSDFFANELYLNKFEESPLPKGNNLQRLDEESSSETERITSVPHLALYEKMPTKPRIKQSQNGIVDLKRQFSTKSYFRNDSYCQEDANKQTSKRIGENSHKKQQQYVKQKWNTDNNLDQRIQDNQFDIQSTVQTQERSLLDSPKTKKIGNNSIQMLKKSNVSLIKNIHPQPFITEDKQAGESSSIHNSFLHLYPLTKQTQSQQKEEQIYNKNIKTQEILGDNGQQQNSPSSSARQFFTNLKKNSLQKQILFYSSQSSNLKGLSSLQNNIESSLDIMKKNNESNKENRGSNILLPNITQTNFIQPYIYSESNNSQRNLESITNSPRSKTQKRESEYQVVINSEQTNDKTHESLNYQIANLLSQKEQEQEVIKWIQQTQQLQNNQIFDSISHFDVGKIFKQYFPKFNYNIVLSLYRKKQLSIRNEIKKNFKKPSNLQNKFFDTRALQMKKKRISQLKTSALQNS